MRRILFASMVGFILAAATTLSAAPPRTTDPSTISLVAPSAGTTGWPALGDTVTFAVTYPAKLKNQSIRVQLVCYQDGNIVYADAMPYTYAFTLGGAASPWTVTGGAASCVADLYYWGNNQGPNFNWLASTTFNVGA